MRGQAVRKSTCISLHGQGHAVVNPTRPTAFCNYVHIAGTSHGLHILSSMRNIACRLMSNLKLRAAAGAAADDDDDEYEDPDTNEEDRQLGQQAMQLFDDKLLRWEGERLVVLPNHLTRLLYLLGLLYLLVLSSVGKICDSQLLVWAQA